jgi:hypothetical protein
MWSSYGTPCRSRARSDGNLVALRLTATSRLHEAANALPPTTCTNKRPWRGPRTPSLPLWGGMLRALRSSPLPWRRKERQGEVRGDKHGRGRVWQSKAAGRKGGDKNAGADTYGAVRGRGGGDWATILDAAVAYMVRMERLYAVDLAVAADDSNNGGGGRGGKAGAPGNNGTACING